LICAGGGKGGERNYDRLIVTTTRKRKGGGRTILPREEGEKEKSVRYNLQLNLREEGEKTGPSGASKKGKKPIVCINALNTVEEKKEGGE